MALDPTIKSAMVTALTNMVNRIVANAGLSQQDVQDLIDASLGNLQNAFNYVGTLAGGADEVSAFDLDSLPEGGKDAGDYYKVSTGGWFIIGEDPAFQVAEGNGIVFNLTDGVDVFDNSVANVIGTDGEIDVVGSVETGFTLALSPAFKARMTDAETAIGDLETALEGIQAKSGIDFVAIAATTDYFSTVLTDVNALVPGKYSGYATALSLGLSAELGGDTVVVPVEVTVTEQASGTANSVDFLVSYRAKLHARSFDGGVEDGDNAGNATVHGWTEIGSGGSGDTEALSRLAVSAPTISAANIVTDLRATVDTFPVGLHTHVEITPAAIGVDGADTTTLGSVITVVSGTTTKVVSQTYTWNGKSAIRTGSSADEDSENPTIMQYSDWYISKDETEELMIALTEAFDNAGPQD